MRGQAVWAVVLVLLQVLGCCCAFGGYPGTFYQMMLLLNKERKYARTAPSPSRLWAVLNPAATLGSLSNVPLDSNRVVRRDLEPRQVEPTTQEAPTETLQPLSEEAKLPSEGEGHVRGESEPTEPTNGGSEALDGVSDGTQEPGNVGSDGGQNGELEPTNGGSESITRVSDGANEGSDAVTEENEATSERPEPTEPMSEVSEPINGESSGGSESTNEGLSETTEPVAEGLITTNEGSEPVDGGSSTTSGEEANTNSNLVSGDGGSSGGGVCGEELVMPSPPASLSPTQGFTLKHNLSTPGWERGRYPEEVECVWNLKVGPECEVGLLLYQVLEGEVVQSHRCLHDYLEFVQPNSHATRYCGPLVNNRDKVSGIDSWHSSQERTTTIRFRSSTPRSLDDRSISGAPRGFLMEVTYYCWLYNKELAAASAQKNEVSDGGQQLRNEGRKEESEEKSWGSGSDHKERKGSGHGISGDESRI